MENPSDKKFEFQKISSMLDFLADHLQSKGLSKHAQEIDLVSNTIEAAQSTSPLGDRLESAVNDHLAYFKENIRRIENKKTMLAGSIDKIAAQPGSEQRLQREVSIAESQINDARDLDALERVLDMVTEKIGSLNK